MFARAVTVNEAIDEVQLLASSLPGDFTIDVTDFEDVKSIEVLGTMMSSGCDVEIELQLAAGTNAVEVPRYRVSVRR